MEFDAVAERFVKVVNKMLISKLSFRQARGAHASRASQAGPHAAFLQVISMLLFEQELLYSITNFKDEILGESRAIYSITAARSKNIRICIFNPVYKFDEGRVFSKPVNFTPLARL